MFPDNQRFHLLCDIMPRASIPFHSCFSLSFELCAVEVSVNLSTERGAADAKAYKVSWDIFTIVLAFHTGPVYDLDGVIENL